MTAAPYWDLLDRVLSAALVPIGAIISGYVILLLHKMAQRLNLKVSEANEERIRTIVQNSLFAVEEVARAQYKMTGQPVPSEDKREDAITRARSKLPATSVGEIEMLVNEELPKVRAQLAPAAVLAPVVVPAQPAEGS